MNSPTTFYKKLCHDLGKAKLLVRNVNMLSCTTDLQELKLNGFILLSHAIVEEYLEELGKEVALLSKDKLLNDNQVTKALIALVTTSVVDKISDRSVKKIKGDLATDLELFAREAVTTYRIKINENHGITDKHQENILLPIGINLKVLDIGLSQNLNSFGRKRGNIAHSFSMGREETLSNINAILNNIKRDLISLDEEACRVCN